MNTVNFCKRLCPSITHIRIDVYYFDPRNDFDRAWTSEMIARVTAPELAIDVPGAEQLLARHNELKTEIDARQDDFQNFYKTGMCCIISTVIWCVLMQWCLYSLYHL